MSAACASSPSFHVNGEQCVCLCSLPCVIESVCACCTCVCVCVCVCVSERVCLLQYHSNFQESKLIGSLLQ